MPEWINERIQDILSSVILYGSSGESKDTTDCYMKYPDNSEKWVKYDDHEFFDTLSYCLDATVYKNTIYCRHYKNKKDEIIKFETTIVISIEKISDFISELRKTDRWLVNETSRPLDNMKSFRLLKNTFFYFRPKPNGGEIKFIPNDEYIDLEKVYETFFNYCKGLKKNENSFSINYYIDDSGKTVQSKPIIISKRYIKDYLKYSCAGI